MKTTTCRGRRPRRPVKRIVSIILSICMLLSLTAGLDFSVYALDSSGSCGKNASYYFNSSTGALTIKGTGDMYDYDLIDNEDSPFIKKQEIKSITIVSGITSIGSDTFYGCTGLTSITIPNGVTRIGSSAFRDCTGLTNVTIPDSVSYISDYAFESCLNLKTVNFGNGIKRIGEEAFSSCSSLTSLTLPDSLEGFGKESFSGCINIKELTMPCSAEVDNDMDAQDVTESTFYGCENIEKITLTKGTGVTQTFSNSTSSEEYHNYKCSPWYQSRNNLKTIIFQEGIEIISPCSFYYCTGITNISFPESLRIIAHDAFYGCSKLVSVSIQSIEDIGNRAFYECTNLSNVTINSANSIGTSAFYKCTNLSNVTINSANSIKNSAFCECTNLSNITINSANSIGLDAFKNTKYYNNDINWKNGLLYIGNNLIAADSNLNGNVSIGSGVRTIAKGAFNNCSLLTSIVLPNTIKEISDGLFANCVSLENFNIPNSVTSIGGGAFSSCRSLTSIIIPDNVTSIGGSAFESCKGLTSITIPDSVTSIGSSAFEGCTGLTSITIKNRDCDIYESYYTISYTATIYGYTGSTAETHAKKYHPKNFVSLDTPQTDTTKPTGSISSTNNVAASQTATLTLSDDKGVAGYYWGTNSNYSSNTYTATSSTSVKKTLSNAGTYYLTVKDTSGNISDTVSITYYKTTLNANGGSVSPASVITKKGNSFTFPTPIMDGYTYQGWSTSSTATSGVKTLNPSGNKTYYAVWKANQQTAPEEEQHVHDYISKVVAPTCTENGYTLKLCTVCGNTYKTEYTFATDHKPVADKAVPATFISAGKTAGTHCSVCGKVIVAQKPIAKLGAAALSKVKKGKKSFTAMWNPVANIDGYEIQYSLKKNMKKAKTKSVASSKKKVKIKKLKAKKNYYVRIRAYKVINGQKQYSAWSAKKKVKTK